MNKYSDWIENRTNLNANDAVDILVSELKKEKIEIPEDKAQLAELIIDHFIDYPLGEGVFPYNYCALSELIKRYLSDENSKFFDSIFKSVLRPFCSH